MYKSKNNKFTYLFLQLNLCIRLKRKKLNIKNVFYPTYIKACSENMIAFDF